MFNLLGKVLSAGEGKKLRKLQEKVQKVNDLEPKISALSDEELRKKTDEFKRRLGAGESLDDILPEAFAVVREVAKRKLKMRHFDVQIMGGVVLYEGKITEMATGEGKTLVATLPVYLNTLEEKGVHVVTVNDYLAKRDAQWMGPIYHFLGLSTSIIQHDTAYIYDPNYEVEDESLQHLRPINRREAYMADVTYGTNNEFGFDYLRDNMALSLEQVSQRDHNYAIIDEVDSILIDEARTPLIISGPAEDRSSICKKVEQDVRRMKWLTIAEESKDVEELNYNEENYDFIANEKENTLKITPRGDSKIARALDVSVDDLSDPEQSAYGVEMLEWQSRYKQSMKAHSLFKKDVDYLVKDGQVVIVDDFTGRLMPGRRYSEGLHEAIEAKEGVHIRQENQTLATITLQNYFRMYEKLAGMTGTAATEADEFIHIYKLETVIIPTNKPLIRKIAPDVIYKTEEAKFQAIVEDIIECSKKGQPVLVGTISVEKSERLNKMLRRRGIEHEVLNAKYHEREAHIVAQAGRKGAVTIATNMAGRGTDIVLGGNPPNPKEAEEVKNAGGLHVIGTERHESRRIDNQLRGRSGRQGDPGSSQFYISLEDNLMRLFGGDRIGGIMQRLGLPDDMPIEHSMISKSVERAQREVESQNFNIRKHVLEYDDVMNIQREIIYEQRKRCLKGENFHEQVLDIIEDVIKGIVEIHTNKNTYPEQWNLDGFFYDISQIIPLSWGKEDLDLHSLKQEELHQKLFDSAKQVYQEKEKELGQDILRELERHIMLQVVDRRWRRQLSDIDYLKGGIGLRAIGQRDPLVEFKREAFIKWEDTMHGIKEDFVKYIFHAHVVKEPHHTADSKTLPSQAVETKKPVKMGKKIGRNDPCSCGSGKKYKKCCGK
ncbi:preprotein translocase subunit SecA [Candidatus Oleimmundimicrobium sp.]|uniref:preprotein translocase subunit SecA n=1 Tax=Candidatus Oleimmundimicrobium sp. TaxID=3060597 RepID=UPI002716EB9A|nr:preprotein translocase subunit SecA [Candidatus Oleimmundimicrobium sp.]MDO8885705.1 preprotein translocase subunit SecA [Candidatus Oleimmundimicrobium sp.]